MKNLDADQSCLLFLAYVTTVIVVAVTLVKILT